MTVGTAHEHREAIGLRVTVDQVIFRCLHFEHRFFQGHRLGALGMIDTKHLLARGLLRARRLLHVAHWLSRLALS